MKIVCAFKEDILLKQEFDLEEEKYLAFKESVAVENNEDINNIDLLIFEDPDLELAIEPSTRPQFTMQIDRDKAILFKQVVEQEEMVVDILWENCDEQQIQQYFSPEQVEQINANKAYYDSLGIEKYQIGFFFQWPYVIDVVQATVNGNVTKTVEHKMVFPIEF